MKIKNRCAYFFIVLLFSVMAAFAIYPSFCDETINIIAGQTASVKIESIFTNVNLKQKEDIIGVNGEFSTAYKVNAKKSLNFFAKKEGDFDFTVNIYNRVVFKHLKVNVISNEKLYVCGDAIGVKVDTSGVIAVGFEPLGVSGGTEYSPAYRAGIREGDIVKAINGVAVDKASEFREVLNSVNGQKVQILLVREGKPMTFTVYPIINGSGNYQIGLWVRDNVSGIGTLTFVTQDKKYFGALGHAITDANTHVTVPMKKGVLLKANVVKITKGVSKAPGELRGVFSSRKGVCGDVLSNTEYGIYGEYKGGIELNEDMLYPIAMQNEITEGPAGIIVTLDDKAEEYAINIIKVNKQNKISTKSMLIEVTDERLIEKTGGIVRGMSGCPIIQNGKIVGAVTHVLVNNPQRGYAIFIEWMLNNLK